MRWHSGRVGGVTDAIRMGVDHTLVADAVGWKSVDMVGRYSKNVGTSFTSKAVNEMMASSAADRTGKRHKGA